DDHAHLRAARADRVDEVPELAARERVDAGRRLVEDEQIRIVDEGAAQAQLLLHAAGELAGGPGLELLHARRGEELGDPLPPFLGALAEQAAEEIDILEHRERRVEIASEPLRHIGDPAADFLEIAAIRDVLVEDENLPLLDSSHPGDQREQGGFADPIRPDHADHDARRNVDADVVEGDRRAVPVRYVLDPRDLLDGHLVSGVLAPAALSSGVLDSGAVAGAAEALSGGGFGSLTWRIWGHSTPAFVRTKPKPLMPVFTRV